MDSRPNEVRVFGRKYSINYIPKSSCMSELGLLDYETLTISIREDQPSIEEADTVLHETIHAIDEVMNLGLTETQVKAIATGVIGVFQDNPEFAEFIIKPR